MTIELNFRIPCWWVRGWRTGIGVEKPHTFGVRRAVGENTTERLERSPEFQPPALRAR